MEGIHTFLRNFAYVGMKSVYQKTVVKFVDFPHQFGNSFLYFIRQTILLHP